MPSGKKLLSLHGLSHIYHSKTGETIALSKVGFTLYQGEFVAIVGPSGCGKSTLLDIIAGFIPTQTGSLRFFDDTPSPSFGYMLQKDHLLEYRSIYKNIILGLEIQHKLTEKNLEYVTCLMRQYGIWDFARALPSELSGGMRQRAALIRTLAGKPDFLLLDEPFSALDYQTRLSVANDIGGIIKEQNLSALLVTHDLSEAISMSDRILVMSSRPGTIKKEVLIPFGKENISPSKARKDPRFQQYFNTLWEELKSSDITNNE